VSKTKENLEKALVGESQAYIRYLAFAEKADEEGYPGVARLFRAASRSEWSMPNLISVRWEAGSK
jgi:rubrerythrin